MEVKLVVFDMDDTLYLERDYVRSGFSAVDCFLRAEYGVEGFEVFAWAEFLNGRRADIFDAVLGMIPGTSQISVKRCVEVYRNHKPRIRMTEDSSEFVAWCAGRFQTALVTDGPALSQRAKVAALGLESKLDRIIVTDEMGEGWPKPGLRPFELLQKEFGHIAEECVYLGDNPHKDFRAPQLLGWKTVRVRRQGGLHESAVTKSDASIVVTDLGEASVQSYLNVERLLT